MDERCPIAILIYPFEIDDELARIVFRICQNFCPTERWLSFGTMRCKKGDLQESDDMITDDFPRFVVKVGVVDAEVGVEPVDFVGDQLLRNKALESL